MASASMPDVLIDLDSLLGIFRGNLLPLMKASPLIIDMKKLKGLTLFIFPFYPIHPYQLIKIPDKMNSSWCRELAPFLESITYFAIHVVYGRNDRGVCSSTFQVDTS